MSRKVTQCLVTISDQKDLFFKKAIDKGLKIVTKVLITKAN